MHPDALIVPLDEGDWVVGPAYAMDAFQHWHWIDGPAAGERLRAALALYADPWRLLAAAVAWGVEDFEPHRRPEEFLCEQIARLVETGRLQVRFLPLFLADPRGPSEDGPLRVLQIDKGPPPVAPPPPPPASSPPPPRTLTPSPPTAPEKDFPNETVQCPCMATAAKHAVPFVEISR